MNELGEHRFGYIEQFGEKYRQMSDAERNGEFFNLWSYLPDFEYEISGERSADDIADSWDQRRDSETTHLLIARFDLLLTHSFITESYGQQLRDNFVESCEHGLYRPTELNNLTQRHRWDVHKNGGIFSPVVAPIIEAEEYQFEVDSHRLDKAQQIKDVYKAFSPPELGIGPFVDVTRMHPAALRNVHVLMKKDVFLQRWRNEYIARFGKNPAEVGSLSGIIGS